MMNTVVDMVIDLLTLFRLGFLRVAQLGGGGGGAECACGL